METDDVHDYRQGLRSKEREFPGSGDPVGPGVFSLENDAGGKVCESLRLAARQYCGSVRAFLGVGA